MPDAGSSRSISLPFPMMPCLGEKFDIAAGRHYLPMTKAISMHQIVCLPGQLLTEGCGHGIGILSCAAASKHAAAANIGHHGSCTDRFVAVRTRQSHLAASGAGCAGRRAGRHAIRAAVGNIAAAGRAVDQA